MPKQYVSRTVPETQQPISWRPPIGTLGQLVEAAGARSKLLLAHKSDLERRAANAPPASSFVDAIGGEHVAIIAEIKRRSPSLGDIKPGLDAATQGRAYEIGGAAAISVLTEETRFGGSSADLSAVRGEVTVPILKKDFHVDEIQLIEARALGASAVLLIVRALPQKKLRELARVAEGLGLEPLLEVHDEAQLDRALETGARIIGVNNRDLETLEIDLGVAPRLLRLIPSAVLRVAESGTRTREDVTAIALAGADAVLVGTALSAARDPAAAVRGLTGVRKARELQGNPS